MFIVFDAPSRRYNHSLISFSRSSLNSCVLRVGLLYPLCKPAILSLAAAVSAKPVSFEMGKVLSTRRSHQLHSGYVVFAGSCTGTL